MKRAEYEDNKRHLSKKWDKKEYSIGGVYLKNIFNWKSAMLKLSYPITLITGKNGCGKSTFINALKHVAQIQKGDEELGILSSIKDYEIVVLNRQEKEIRIKNKKIEKKDFSFPMIRDFTFNSRAYSFFKGISGIDMENYRKTLEQYDIKYLPGELLNILREIIGKDITSAERIYDDEEEREYYRLKLRDGTEYDSFTMGSGEFYVNQFIWSLSSLQEKSLVLIEELENFVHCEAQKKMLEMIYQYALKKNVQFILTTHSPTMIDHSEISSRILININQENNVVSINNATNWLARETLGTGIQNKAEIIVEDSKSEMLLMSILQQFNPQILNNLIITQYGSESNIDKCIKINNTLKSSKVIGVIDADSKIPEGQNLFKFPGKKSPEETVMDYLLKNHYVLAKKLDKKPADVKTIIDQVNTLVDPHEWFTKAAHRLGEEPSFLWFTSAKIWAKSYSQSNDLKKFNSKIEKAINGA